MYAAIRHALDECGQPSAWRWLDSVDEVLAGKGVKYMALVTQKQKDQEAAANEWCFVLALLTFYFGTIRIILSPDMCVLLLHDSISSVVVGVSVRCLVLQFWGNSCRYYSWPSRIAASPCSPRMTCCSRCQ